MELNINSGDENRITEMKNSLEGSDNFLSRRKKELTHLKTSHSN